MPSSRRQKQQKQRATRQAQRTRRADNPGGASNYARKRAWLLSNPDMFGFVRHCVPFPKPWK